MPFNVGLTGDFLTSQGKPVYEDMGLDLLRRAPEVEHRILESLDLKDLDVLISLGATIGPKVLKDAKRLLAVCRFGVNIDMIDVPALTEADVALFVAAGAVDHTLAESALAYMLALGPDHLRDRVLGLVGLNGVGRRLAQMVKPLKLAKILAHDPKAGAPPKGVDLVSLDRLMVDADFVAVSEGPRVGRHEIGLMKPGAALMSASGAVDETALIEALKSGRLAGARVDVFSDEPAATGRLLATGVDVTLAPNAAGGTTELYRDIGVMACSQALSLSRGEIPPGLVNREVLRRPGFVAKLRRGKAPGG